MTSTPLEKLAALGITLPEPVKAVANYVPAMLHGNVLNVSGQLPFMADGSLRKGLVGVDVSVEEAQLLARQSAIHLLAQAQAVLGDLSRIKQVIRLGGFVASGPDFTQHSVVMNGASDLMVAVLGEAGRHARSSVGVSCLPLGAPVEVEASFGL
jgi:enamine deaminase RidA (YjgF/YER057c/UK114 family)